MKHNNHSNAMDPLIEINGSNPAVDSLVESNGSNLEELARKLRSQLVFPGIYIWGPPGAGKTSAITSYFTSRGYHVEVVIPALSEPSDFLGFPIPDNSGNLYMAPAPWVRRIVAAAEEGKPSILVLDELNNAPRTVEAAALRVVCEKRAGDVQLPRTGVIAISNPRQFSVSQRRLSHAMSNRFIHINWPEHTAKGVAGGLMTGEWNSPINELWEYILGVKDIPDSALLEASQIVGKYLYNSSDDVVNYKEPRDIDGRMDSVPTARTWQYVVLVVAAELAVNRSGNISNRIANLVIGAIGHEEGGLFMRYVSMLAGGYDKVFENPRAFVETIVQMDPTTQENVWSNVFEMLERRTDPRDLANLKEAMMIIMDGKNEAYIGPLKSAVVGNLANLRGKIEDEFIAKRLGLGEFLDAFLQASGASQQATNAPRG